VLKVVSPAIDGPNVALVIRFEHMGEEGLRCDEGVYSESHWPYLGATWRDGMAIVCFHLYENPHGKLYKSVELDADEQTLDANGVQTLKASILKKEGNRFMIILHGIYHI
jgi:hypothetical protein